MFKSLVFFLSCILITPLTGCALAAHGRTQLIPFSSTPTGAEVFIDGEPRGFTPLELELRRNQSYDVALRFQGQEQKIRITNIPEGGLIALDVAPASISGATTLYICIDAATQGPANNNDLEFEFGFLFCTMSLAVTGLFATPIAVDAVNGAWYYLSPNEVSVSFSD
jgi:PEGA domain